MVCRVAAAVLLLLCSHTFLTQEKLSDGRPRPLVLRPILRPGISILYRRHQLDPALMRRSAPEEVVERYARRHREENELLAKLNPTGDEPVFFQSGRLRPARYAIMLMRS